MSELLDKQVNAQKEKTSRAPTSTHVKVCNENETKKNDTRVKMLLMEGSPLQSAYKKLVKHELQVNDYGYNEGTICLVNR